MYKTKRTMMRGLKIITILLYCALAAGALLTIPRVADAEEADHLLINEIYPAPISNCDQTLDPNCTKEWVELYNPTNNIINLYDYILSDGDGNPKTFDTSDTIINQGYFILYSTSGWLNNTGDEIFLKFKNPSSVIDQVSYGSWSDGNINDNALKPANGQSISRIPNGQDTDVDSDDFQIVPVTKGSENILPPPIIYSDKIIINEIVPTPADGADNEYIELYNGGDEIVDLGGWILDDADGGSSAFVIPYGTFIASFSYHAFKKSLTNIALNDSGDKARLFSPDNFIKSEIEYSGSKRGESYSKFVDGWKWSLSLTPDAENIFTAETVGLEYEAPDTIETIKAVREKSPGTQVTVIGTVSVLPGVLSSQYFYIQDDLSGIQIYCYKKDFPNLKIGDVILVTGEVAEYYNEKRIKIASASDIVILSSRDPPPPKVVKIDDINEELEGQIITVEGIVVSTSGDTFYIHGSGIIKVVIRGTTNINKPKMRKGDKVRITGIVSQYKDSYRILPLDQDDVILLSSGTLPKAGMEFVYYLISSALVSQAWMSLLLKIKKKQRPWRQTLLKKYPKVVASF
jgi:DNA/RNA endonuclease YhcR with UshA esterase domain